LCVFVEAIIGFSVGSSVLVVLLIVFVRICYRYRWVIKVQTFYCQFAVGVGLVGVVSAGDYYGTFL